MKICVYYDKVRHGWAWTIETSDRDVYESSHHGRYETCNNPDSSWLDAREYAQKNNLG